LTDSYSIRYSKKAKYLRLSVSALKGIEVVVPDFIGRDQAQLMAQNLVENKKAWLKKTLSKFNVSLPAKAPQELPLPEKLELKAIDQVLSISYEQQQSAWLTIEKSQADKLSVKGDLQNRALLLESLEGYLKQLAKFYLRPQLDFFSRKYALDYNKVTIRGQKTRWGSCSSQKNISLNYKLLFIEKDLADYVLLHELAHTRHLNHSADFWGLLKTLRADCQQLDRRLNDVGSDIPEWVVRLKQM